MTVAEIQPILASDRCATESGMTRRPRIRPTRLTIVLGAAVVLLGALSLYAATRGARLGLPEEPARERALRQVREQRGPAAELRYSEAGEGRALCGYVGERGRPEAVAFVSRPNRILFSDDPLPREFTETRRRFCPGFLQRPPA
jgi:hypothetical protein